MESVELHALAATISALGQIGDKRAAEPLLKLLSAQKECVSFCKTIIKALGRIGDLQAVDFLFSYLVQPKDKENEYESYTLKSTAASALARIGGDPVINQAKEWLHHPNPDVPYWALSLLGDVGDPRTLEAITPFFKHPSKNLRSMALTAVGKIKDPKATEALVSYVKENSDGRNEEDEEEVVKNLVQRGDLRAKEVIANYAMRRHDRDHLKDLYENAALKAEKEGRDEEAIFCYQELLKMNPETDYAFADFHFNLGALYQKIGQPEQAKHHWKISFLYCSECDEGRAEKALWKLKGQTPKALSKELSESGLKGVRGLGETRGESICGTGACSSFPGLSIHYGPKGERFCAPCERVIFQSPETGEDLLVKEICPKTSKENGKAKEAVEIEARDMLFWEIFKRGVSF